MTVHAEPHGGARSSTVDHRLATDVSNPPRPIEDDPHLGPRVVPRRAAPLPRAAAAARRRAVRYLVPDAELLPLESIRFFYLDRAWTDALVQGALSVGTVNTADRAQLESALSRSSATRSTRRSGASACPAAKPSSKGPRRPDHRLPAALARGVRLAGPARARVPRGARRGRRRGDSGIGSAPPQAAAHGAARAGGAARAVRRHPGGRAHRGAAPGHPVRRAARADGRRPNHFKARVTRAQRATRRENVNPIRTDSCPCRSVAARPACSTSARLNASLMNTPGTNMGPTSTAPSSRCRCCASRIARCSAIRTPAGRAADRGRLQADDRARRC